MRGTLKRARRFYADARPRTSRPTIGRAWPAAACLAWHNRRVLSESPCPIKSLRENGARGASPNWSGRSTSCARSTQRARFRPHASRLPVHRHARRRQDDDRAHLRQVAELRARAVVEPVRRMRRLPRHRRRPLRRPARNRRRQQHRRRRRARADRERAVHAGARPLQGVPDRRSAHAVEERVQRAAEDARGAAAARQVPARDDRSAETAGDGAVALPASST